MAQPEETVCFISVKRVRSCFASPTVSGLYRLFGCLDSRVCFSPSLFVSAKLHVCTAKRLIVADVVEGGSSFTQKGGLS